MSPPVRRFLIMGSIVVAVGAANAWYRSSKKADAPSEASKPAAAITPSEPQRALPFTAADIRFLPENKNDLNIVLYQYSYQPSSAQVRSYLDLRKLKYKAVEVNPLTKNHLPCPPDQRKAKQIPLVHINNREISVAVHTILFLELYLNRNNPFQPSREESARVADLMYHIDQNLMQLVQADRYATLRSASRTLRPLRQASNLSVWERVSAPPMAALSLWWQWRHARRLLRGVYGDDLRLALVRELDAYCDLLGDREFFNGAEPGLVDVHLFGVLRSVADEATGHYALAHAHSRLPAWYQRMQRLTAHDDDQPTTTTTTTKS